jgi:hypothetical protein
MPHEVSDFRCRHVTMAKVVRLLVEKVGRYDSIPILFLMTRAPNSIVRSLSRHAHLFRERLLSLLYMRSPALKIRSECQHPTSPRGTTRSEAKPRDAKRPASS